MVRVTLLSARSRPVLAAALLAASAAAASGCGGAATAKPTQTKLDAAGELSAHRQAPEFVLRDSTGARVRLAQFRGKAVMLTFIYDHCPDTCPLIVDKLRQAQVRLGANAHELQVLAVSVDPRGDTPATVAAFLAKHRMTGRMDYLIGTSKELAPVWQAYGIASEASPESREVSHTALVYGITASGRWLALYDQSFQPQEIAHDVPLLAAM
jgi:protein SCO1/2